MKKPYITPESELLSVTTAAVVAISNYWNWGDGKKDDFEEENEEYQGDHDDEENDEIGLGDLDPCHRRMWNEEDNHMQ